MSGVSGSMSSPTLRPLTVRLIMPSLLENPANTLACYYRSGPAAIPLLLRGQRRRVRDQRLEVDARGDEPVEIGARPAEAGDARERVLHGLGGVEHLEIAAKAAGHLQPERHAV